MLRRIAAAWAGAALFAISLGYFAYVYMVRLGRDAQATESSSAAALAIDVALFSAFALHHSIFARTGARAWIARRVPAGLERSVYVWLASLLFIAVCWWWQPLPGSLWHVAGPGRWLLHALQVGGLVLTLRAAARIDIWELAGVRQARRVAQQSLAPSPSAPSASSAASPSAPSAPSAASPSAPSAASAAAPCAPSAASPSAPSAASAAALEIRGPYRWVRHPIYFGWILLVWPVPHMTMTRLAFAAVSTAYLAAAIPFEERTLTEHFGPDYTAYQRQVRWRMFPGVW